MRQRVDVLREEFLTTAEELMTTQDHVQVLLAAVVSMAEDVGLDTILDRVVTSGCELVGARFGALGVIGDDDHTLSSVTATGLDPERRAHIAALPTGRGVLRVPLRVREKAFGTLYLAEKAGGADFSDEDEALCLALAAAAGVAIDNARHHEANTRRRRWLEAGVNANEHILTAAKGHNPKILALIAEHALAASDSTLASIAFTLPDGIRLACQAGAGTGSPAPGTEFELPPAIAAVLSTGVPATLRSAAEALGAGAGKNPGPALALPLTLPGMGQGVLILARDATSPPYSSEDTETGLLFSSRVALAVELVQERKVRESLLLAEDRDRIARDLHDRVIQRIFAAGLSLQSLRHTITDEPSLHRVSSITGELDTAIRELRETIYSLHQPLDSLEPLGHRILRTIAALSAGTRFEPRINLTGPLDDGVPAGVAEHLMAVITEGISNAAQHSGAHHLTITIDVGPLLLTLAITDDGDGFHDPGPTSGMANMQHRAATLGGSCSIESTPGEGTTLSWTVPHAQAGTPFE